MNNIKNKFPEIRYFIENPKGYEVLYYKEDSIHNEYPLDVKEAKEIISTIEILEQQLKKKQDVIDKVKEWEQNHTILVYTKNAPRELVGTHELLHILYEDKEVK